MAATVAGALRQFGAAYLAQHALSTSQAKAWRAIVACRTAALGGQQLACDACGHSHWQYHSCRNRHCPQCGARAKDAWLQGRLAELLPVPYVHLVFTLPHELNALYGVHPRWVIDTLFASTAQTLNAFAANARWMGMTGGTPAFTLVLHTWTQDLARHIHLHAVMACGVLQDGHWYAPNRKPDFLFPVQALSKVFRGKFLQALGDAHQAGQIAADPQGAGPAWHERQRALYRHDWVVYAKAPLGGPAQALQYLSRYTHRTAIGNERIRAVTHDEVVLSVRADKHGGKKLDAARRDLQMPAPHPQAIESACEFLKRVARIDVLQCPCCKTGQLRCVQQRGLAQMVAGTGRRGATQPGTAVSCAVPAPHGAPPRQSPRCGWAVAWRLARTRAEPARRCRCCRFCRFCQRSTHRAALGRCKASENGPVRIMPTAMRRLSA